MPATSLGIRYPSMKEVIDAADFQTMAEDIDSLLFALNTKRSLARKRLSSSITGSANSVAVTTLQNLVFTTETWDVGGLANLGVNNDRMTVPSGVYLVLGSAFITGWTTVDFARLAVTHNGTIHTGHQLSRNSLISANLQVTALVVNGADGGILRLQAYWAGTGGPADWIPKMTALRLRPI